MSRINDLNNAELQDLLDGSASYADVIKRIGLIGHGGNYITLKRRITQDGLSTSRLEQNRISTRSKRGGCVPTPLENVLVEHSTFNTNFLKKRLVREGLLDYICSKCGNDGEWECSPLVLQIEHINGNNNDNRMENLTILCPNCHSQTATYAGGNCKRKRKTWSCRKCGKDISANSTYCQKCVIYPSKLRFQVSYQDLYDLVHVQKLPYTVIGKKFGVSDNAIRKRCRRMGVPVRKIFTKSN